MTKTPSDLSQVHHNLGNVFFRKGDYSRAIKSYQKSIKLNDRNYKVYYDLACAFGNVNDYENAINNYKKALTLNNKDIYALNALASIYLSKGNTKDAKTCAESLSKSAPHLAEKIFTQINSEK